MARIVLITGCSSGFGRAAAEAFGKAGWTVVATMRDPERWPTPPAGITVLPLDVSDSASITRALSTTVERFGGVDCLVNNAGVGLFSIFESTPIDKVKQVFDVNFFGMMDACQQALPYLRKSRGTIINVSSGAVIVPDPLMTTYAASKWALEGFAEALMYEVEQHGVKVKLIEPGFAPTTDFVPSVMKNSVGIEVPEIYQPLVDYMLAYYSGESEYPAMTDKDVAEAIVAAATDDSPQLRYLVGEQARHTASIRREAGEEQYLAWARGRFARS